MHGSVDHKTAAVVLAAGLSKRFGSDDKLLADLDGQPLVGHVFGTLCNPILDLDWRLAVVSNENTAALAHHHGFNPIFVSPGCEQSQSLAAGIAALPRGCTRTLLLLGDMPFIEARSLRDILAKEAPACACYGQVVLPPALFPAQWNSALTGISGDKGASARLRQIPEEGRVKLRQHELRDIDTTADLADARQNR